jgi:7-cyano-7-deazaguanine reductase
MPEIPALSAAATPGPSAGVAPAVERARAAVPRPQLETFPKPASVTRVTFRTDELTSLCPRTGQPDFNTLTIDYRPHDLCVESRSLKLYLQSYRQTGAFCEQLAADICADVVAATAALHCVVVVEQHTRGGIVTTATAELPAAP